MTATRPALGVAITLLSPVSGLSARVHYSVPPFGLGPPGPCRPGPGRLSCAGVPIRSVREVAP